MSKTTDWDALMASSPLDKTAATVAQGKGESYSPRAQVTGADKISSDTPLPTKQVMKNAPDYTGMKFGRLTVIGLSALKKTGATSRWVVRCVCGKYEHRHIRKLKKATDPNQLVCAHCDFLLRLQKGKVSAPPAKLKMGRHI